MLAGRYRLLRQIGEGAMGAVWSAVDQVTTREVALKLLVRPEPELRARLLREARACGALKHRNIISVFDIAELDGGEPFLVMELLTGETLGELLERRRRLEPDVAALIGRDVAKALSAAHAMQIIHRDLKPANSVLHHEPDTEGHVITVLDFGISKNLGYSDGLHTVAGGAVGSPFYMSPEQVRGDPDVDYRADIWALGVVLFEMLTGVRPFQGETPEVFAKIQRGEIPSVTRYVRRVDEGLSQIVSRCLSRDRDLRFASAAEAAAHLDAFAAPSSTGAGSPWPAGAGQHPADRAAELRYAPAPPAPVVAPAPLPTPPPPAPSIPRAAPSVPRAPSPPPPRPPVPSMAGAVLEDRHDDDDAPTAFFQPSAIRSPATATPLPGDWPAAPGGAAPGPAAGLPPLAEPELPPAPRGSSPAFPAPRGSSPGFGAPPPRGSSPGFGAPAAPPPPDPFDIRGSGSPSPSSNDWAQGGTVRMNPEEAALYGMTSPYAPPSGGSLPSAQAPYAAPPAYAVPSGYAAPPPGYPMGEAYAPGGPGAPPLKGDNYPPPPRPMTLTASLPAAGLLGTASSVTPLVRPPEGGAAAPAAELTFQRPLRPSGKVIALFAGLVIALVVIGVSLLLVLTGSSTTSAAGPEASVSSPPAPASTPPPPPPEPPPSAASAAPTASQSAPAAAPPPPRPTAAPPPTTPPKSTAPKRNCNGLRLLERQRCLRGG
ncbi:MAG: serine/threonine protein kinase [Polyangiaceae bacterium]|nr:serine/threonine protein kinase [Polyangiaceae bacterium]